MMFKNKENETIKNIFFSLFILYFKVFLSVFMNEMIV